MDGSSAPDGARAALVVAVPGARALVDPFRARFLPVALERGLPPHVTLLFPITPAADRRTEDVVMRLAARHAAFAARLERVATFVDHVWLAPEPAERFGELVAAARRAFPDCPPYGSPGLEPVPHLTIGAAAEDELRAVEARARDELGPSLPLAFRVEALTLLAEHPDGRWRQVAQAPLRGR